MHPLSIIMFFTLAFSSACTKKTKHGSCDDCNEEEKRVWVYIYESNSSLNAETCLLCKPLDGGIETCEVVYEWDWNDEGEERSEGPYECALTACKADAGGLPPTEEPDIQGILDQYDADSWNTDCAE